MSIVSQSKNMLKVHWFNKTKADIYVLDATQVDSIKKDSVIYSNVKLSNKNMLPKDVEIMIKKKL